MFSFVLLCLELGLNLYVAQTDLELNYVAQSGLELHLSQFPKCAPFTAVNINANEIDIEARWKTDVDGTLATLEEDWVMGLENWLWTTTKKTEDLG